MKTLLSCFRAVRGAAAWVGQGFVTFWRVYKFDAVPNEKNLLLGLWYDFVHYKHVKPGATIHEFLDSRIVYYKRIIEDPDQRPKKRQMSRDLVDALYERSIRAEIITFLQAPAPEKGYQALIDKIYGAWRSEERQPETNIVARKVEVMEERPVVEERNAKLAEKDGKEAPFNAKTYFIAADIYFELAGKQAEFKKLSRQLPDLAKFVQRQFGVSKLPGSFRKLREYAYKDILKENNDSRLGQLKPHFRQIIDNPQIFGAAVAKRAREILDDYFL